MKINLALVGLLATTSLCVACFAAEQPSDSKVVENGDASKHAPLRVSIHYFDGLSARSGSDPQEIRFLHYGCHLSLLLTNLTKNEIWLWKPYCPEGDDAIRLEFKLNEKSNQIGVARTSHAYTGGMGIPKTIKLAPGDSLVYRIDFSSFWSLPFILEPGAESNLLVRAVYESQPIDPKRSFAPADATKVWQGRIETDWERVRIANATDSKVPDRHRGINLLSPNVTKP